MEEQLWWEQQKAGERRTERRELFQKDRPTVSRSNKRLEEEQNNMKGARRKRRKYQLLEEEWGEKMVPTNRELEILEEGSREDRNGGDKEGEVIWSREPSSIPPTTKVIEGGGRIVANLPDKDILLRMRAAT